MCRWKRAKIFNNKYSRYDKDLDRYARFISHVIFVRFHSTQVLKPTLKRIYRKYVFVYLEILIVNHTLTRYVLPYNNVSTSDIIKQCDYLTILHYGFGKTKSLAASTL